MATTVLRTVYPLNSYDPEIAGVPLITLAGVDVDNTKLTAVQARAVIDGVQLVSGGVAGSPSTASPVAQPNVTTTTPGPPVSGTYTLGQLSVDSTGTGWVCTIAGTPGTWALLGAGTFVRSGLGYVASIPAYDLLASNLPKWRAALNGVRAGISSAKLLCVGDSTVAGYGATPPTSWPNVMRGLLNSTFPTAPGYAIPKTLVVDTRWSTGTGWAYSGGTGPAGASYFADNTATGNLTFTPGVNCDTFDIYYRGAPGTLHASVDGGTVSNVDTNPAPGPTFYGKVTITVAAGSSHVLTLTPPTVGAVYIVGVDAYLSTVPAVRVGNWGVSGSKASDWATGFASPDAIKFYAPDLTIIQLGVNDATAGTTAATQAASMQTLITAAKASGDVILASVDPSSSGAGNPTLELAYRAQLLTLAPANNAPWVDINKLIGDYTTGNAAGLYADGLHLNATGYAKVAAAFYSALTSV